MMHVEKLANHAERAARACAIAIGFTIPISAALDNFLLVLLLLFWFCSGMYPAKLAAIRSNRVALAALGLFAILVLGVIWADDLHAGIDMVGKYLDLAFVPILVTLFRGEETRRRAWIAFASAMVLTLVLSCAMRLGVLDDVLLLLGDRNDPVPFKQYLTQSILMAFAAFLFAQFALHSHRWQGKLGGVMLSVLACANVAFMTEGRTGQVLIAVLVGYLALSLWRWGGAVVAMIVVAVATVTLSMSPMITERLSQAVDEWRDWQPARAASTSVGLRLEFYRNSLQILRDLPIAGVGTGGFASAYRNQVAGSNQRATSNPHNEYLNIGVQVGVVGLVALLY
jgi:O-antigen ligase